MSVSSKNGGCKHCCRNVKGEYRISMQLNGYGGISGGPYTKNTTETENGFTWSSDWSKVNPECVGAAQNQIKDKYEQELKDNINQKIDAWINQWHSSNPSLPHCCFRESKDFNEEVCFENCDGNCVAVD